MSNRTPEQLEAEIASQREQLADTVDQLTAKLDVKSHARTRVTRVRDRATTESGSPRPELLAAAGAVVALVAAMVWWRHR